MHKIEIYIILNILYKSILFKKDPLKREKEMIINLMKLVRYL